MRRCCCGILPVLLVICGCGDFSNEPVARPDPLPMIDRGHDPEPPPLPPVDEGPPPVPLVERAREFLPPEPPDMIGDFEVDGVVVRCLESYFTDAGCTVSLLLLSLDEDRQTGIAPTSSLYLDRDQHLLSCAITRDLTLSEREEFESVPILLPANTPVALDLYWRDVTRAPRIFSIVFRHADLPLEIPGNVACQANLDEDNWPAMQPEEIDAGLRHLAQCETLAPGTANWFRLPERGAAAIEFTALPVRTGSFSGQFFMVDDRGVKHSKEFNGQLTRDDERGRVDITLQTARGSGIRGTPTDRISTWNLLLQGSAISLNLRLYGHELIGSTTDGVTFDITGARFEDPAIELLDTD